MKNCNFNLSIPIFVIEYNASFLLKFNFENMEMLWMDTKTFNLND